jgi:hypothetical protein
MADKLFDGQHQMACSRQGERSRWDPDSGNYAWCHMGVCPVRLSARFVVCEHQPGVLGSSSYIGLHQPLICYQFLYFPWQLGGPVG